MLKNRTGCSVCQTTRLRPSASSSEDSSTPQPLSTHDAGPSIVRRTSLDQAGPNNGSTCCLQWSGGILLGVTGFFSSSTPIESTNPGTGRNEGLKLVSTTPAGSTNSLMPPESLDQPLGKEPVSSKPTLTVSPVSRAARGRTTNSPLRFSIAGGGASPSAGSTGSPSTVQLLALRCRPTVRGSSLIGSEWGLRSTKVPRTSSPRRSGKSRTSASTPSSAAAGLPSQVAELRFQ